MRRAAQLSLQPTAARKAGVGRSWANPAIGSGQETIVHAPGNGVKGYYLAIRWLDPSYTMQTFASCLSRYLPIALSKIMAAVFTLGVALQRITAPTGPSPFHDLTLADV